MTVEDRLAKLERCVAVYRCLTAVLAALMLLVITVAATSARDKVRDEVRTRKLVVVDPSGREAASIEATATTTALQIGSYRDGIRIEHGARTSGIQLICPAHKPIEGGEGFQTNVLTLHIDRFKSGLYMINPGQAETFTSHGRVWLDTEKGFEMSRTMFDASRVFTTLKQKK